MRKIVLMLMLVATYSITLAQERQVSGRVTATEDGSAIPGVNVVVKGTTNGTITDSDGNYKISVPQSGGALVFSFVGLQTQEVLIGERTVVDVALSLDVTQLSEVVVTALGLEVDKDKLGSASSNLKGDLIQRSGEATMINGVAGKISGVNISRTSGDPGAGSYIQIRGQSSITRSVQPLIVVDGVPISNTTGGSTGSVVQQSRINDINPNDIQSMEVLKGASAAALWGTRASNGVIMITTKKGTSGKGKVNISLSTSYSTDEVLKKHPLQKRWGQGLTGYYLTNENALINSVVGNSGNSFSWGDFIPNRSGLEDDFITEGEPNYQGYFLAEDGSKYYAVREPVAFNGSDVHGGKNSREVFDPYNQLFRKGNYLENNLSISGGDKDGNFYLSIGDLNQNGIIVGNSDYRRTSFRINTERRMTEWIKLSSNFMYSKISSSRIQQGSNVNGIFLAGLRTSPDFDNSDYVGTYYNAAGFATLGAQRAYRSHIGRRIPAYDNPLWVTNRNLDRSQVDRVVGMLQIDVSPFSWLTLTSRAGLDHYSDRIKTFFPVNTAGALASGQLTLQTNRETQFNFDGFANAAFELNNNFNLNTILGINFNHQAFDNIGATTQNLLVQQNVPENIQNAPSANRVPFNTLVFLRRSAGYLTGTLDYKEQISLNYSLRGERSSTFTHSNNPLFLFPALDLAWRFTESFKAIQNETFSFGKLRAAFGQTANSPGAYVTQTYFGSSVYGEGWGSTLNGSAYGGAFEQGSVLGNLNLDPEVKTEIEVGTDLRFLKDRLSFSFTYFKNNVDDVLLNVSIPGTSGFTNKTGNVGSLTNNGIEIDLNGEIVNKSGFVWNVYGNWTRIRNKVTDLAGSSSVFLNGFAGTSSRAVEGYPVGVIWGTKYARDNQGKLILDDNGFPTAATEESVLGDPNPDWRGGIGTSLSYKGFTLSALLEHSHGGQIWGGTRGALFYFGTHADTDKEVTLSPAQASSLLNYEGYNAIDWGYAVNEDGNYLVRGYIHDFGGGDVLVDEAWYQSLGGGFGTQAEDFIESAQWTKLREVALSYKLQSEGFKKFTKLSSVEFSATGRNLFLWTKFKGNDPETNLTGPTNGRGLEYFNNPATRSFVFSIKINY